MRYRQDSMCSHGHTPMKPFNSNTINSKHTRRTRRDASQTPSCIGYSYIHRRIYSSLTALLNPCFCTCACAAAITVAAFGSLNPQPVFPFWLLAASALHTPSPVAATWEQQAEEQSASDTQPPVINCAPLPAPTFLAPALLGVRTAAAMVATAWMLVCNCVSEENSGLW